tara:strand:- start:104 stop:1555 length:1452 start_codon:yes stop_codon:yes gene_type:complete
MNSLQKIVDLTQKLSADTIRDPIKYWQPTPIQSRVLCDESNIVLLRGGNQIGKTMVGVYETHSRCIGAHRFKNVEKKPIVVWIIVHSWEQSKVIQAKFWELAPKDELHKDTEYIPGKGFKGKYPIVRYKNGSIAFFKTTGQGTLGVASGTVDFMWIDEVPPPQLWGELKARITRTRGDMLITLTPIGAPIDYMKKMVEDGLISEHVGIMSVENCTPLGCKPMLNQADIDALSISYLPIDRAARMSGDWEGGVPDGRIFDSFTTEMINDFTPSYIYYDEEGKEKNRNLIWTIGIDHGHDIASQVAILACVDMTIESKPHVYVVDEYISDGAGANIHAHGIITMLKNNDLEIADINRWTGDRAHGGSKKGVGKMNNAMLSSGFAHVLGYPKSNLPFKIKTAYKPAWSVWYGSQLIHELMCSGRFQIFPKCDKTITSLKNWALKKSGAMDTMSPHKHAVDALRYGIMPVINLKYNSPRISKLKRKW